MPLIINDDKIWFDEAQKLKHICLRVSDVCNNGQRVLLLSHFESALATLARLLREKGITCSRAQLNLSDLVAGRPACVWLSQARAFHLANQVTSRLEKATLEIIVAEHHPLQSRDQEVVNAAANLGCEATLTFYFSLDDPLMK